MTVRRFFFCSISFHKINFFRCFSNCFKKVKKSTASIGTLPILEKIIINQLKSYLLLSPQSSFHIDRECSSALLTIMQIIKLNKSYSYKRDVIFGAPQGSKLGPILFTIPTSNLFFLTKLSAFIFLMAIHKSTKKFLILCLILIDWRSSL